MSPAKQTTPDVRRSQIYREHPMFDYYHTLVTSLQRGTVGSTPQIVGLTSSFGGEGVSTVASNLAIVATQSVERGVLLVDGHLARPSVDLTMRVPLTPGLTDYLADAANLPECLYAASFEKLTLMPAGSSRGRSDAQHDIRGLAQLFNTLRAEFGMIVVDLPPIENLNSCASLARLVDGVLMVVASEKTSAAAAQRANASLQRAGVNVLGAVLNGHRQHMPDWLERKL